MDPSIFVVFSLIIIVIIQRYFLPAQNSQYFSALQLSFDKNMSRYMTNNTKGATMKKNVTVSSYQLNGYGPVGSMARGQLSSSRSEPGLAWQRTTTKSSVPAQRLPSNRGTYRKKMSTSQYVTRTGPQLPVPTLNGTGLTKTKSQFVCSPVDVSKTMSQPPVLEFTQKRKESTG